MNYRVGSFKRYRKHNRVTNPHYLPFSFMPPKRDPMPQVAKLIRAMNPSPEFLKWLDNYAGARSLGLSPREAFEISKRFLPGEKKR